MCHQSARPNVFSVRDRSAVSPNAQRCSPRGTTLVQDGLVGWLPYAGPLELVLNALGVAVICMAAFERGGMLEPGLQHARKRHVALGR
jgi:hypothetical protein